MRIRGNIPNMITSFRLVATCFLFFLEPCGAAFFVVYSLAGLSDVLDGFVARKLGVTSEIGAKLDSIADLAFYAMMLVRLFPVLLARLSHWIWYAVGLLLTVRLCAYLIAAFRFHRFASLHTWMNKLTGLMLFATPYLTKLPVFSAFCWTVCAIGMLASVEELIIHLRQKDYSATVKSVFADRKKDRNR